MVVSRKTWIVQFMMLSQSQAKAKMGTRPGRAVIRALIGKGVHSFETSCYYFSKQISREKKVYVVLM